MCTVICTVCSIELTELVLFNNLLLLNNTEKKSYSMAHSLSCNYAVPFITQLPANQIICHGSILIHASPWLTYRFLSPSIEGGLSLSAGYTHKDS